MNRVTVEQGQFWYKGRSYGSSEDILVYPGEDSRPPVGLSARTITTPENIDILFSVGERVVGCEVKTVDDMINSWKSRRLHRQLLTIRKTCDIGVLIIRLGNISTSQELYTTRLLEDLVNAQTQRVYLYLVPMYGYLSYIGPLRRALSTSGTRIFAGDDRRDTERHPGWLLRRIPGIGAVRSAALIKRFVTTHGVFQAAVKGRLRAEFGPAIERAILKALEE